MPLFEEVDEPFKIRFAFKVTFDPGEMVNAPIGSKLPLPLIVCGVSPFINNVEEVNPVADPNTPLLTIFPEMGEDPEVFK